MEKWLVSAKKADFNDWALEFQISPVLARIIRNRDITEKDDVRKYLSGTMADCYSPFLLSDCGKAVELILQKIKEEVKIRVIGDYDVDGICSSYILTKGLLMLGGNVDTAIPHRIHDGYGLNDNLIEKAREDGVGLIVTCDNGIAAASQIELAKTYGMSVVVTDHHEVPYMEERGKRLELLPPADAVIDPKQSRCRYPFSGICGGVTAFKLIQALAEKSESDVLQQHLGDLLQFAAIATVCDVMELKDENRIIVKEGLKLLRRTSNPGIRALMEVNGIEPAKLSAYHLGFVIGPCLNATGRLDTAHRALELLNARTLAEAMKAATELKALNDSRKNLTLQGVEEANAYIKANDLLKKRVLVVYLPDVHESLAGIIAGRIRETYNRPVFVLTKGEEGIKGSGRSIETYHMYENMTRVKECFSKYGGHKLAAGLTLAPLAQDEEGKEESMEIPVQVRRFDEALNDCCELTKDDMIPRVHIDVPMPISYADMPLAEDLEKLEPFGVGNPKPLFAEKNLHFRRGYKMGAKKNFARFLVTTSEGLDGEMVFFGDLEKFGAFLEEKFGPGSSKQIYETACDFTISVTYQLGINTYKGVEKLQFIMQNYQ